MTAIGLDIGTTKLCALALDEDSGAVLRVLHESSPALAPAQPYETVQDAEAIAQAALRLVGALENEYTPVRCIGISGAMHGIVWLNGDGVALSPLHTWQDQTAAQPAADSGVSWAETLSRTAGRPVPPGYGLATVFAQLGAGTAPAGAKKIATIGDYVAMRLTGAAAPVIHPTNAAGIGLFDVRHGRFDQTALEKAGISASLLPRLSGDSLPAGLSRRGTPVYTAVGDNQAAFAGAVRDAAGTVLVNIGTGSQLTLAGDNPAGLTGLETRPWFDGKFLYAVAALCGGSAFALLESLFRDVSELAGLPVEENIYPAMDRLLALGPPPGPPLRVRPTFLGTRQNPAQRGIIDNIGTENLTAAHLAWGFLQGMADELHSQYAAAGPEAGRAVLVAAGNGVRKNPALAGILAQCFGLKLHLPAAREEAARGAALYALAGAGRYPGTGAAMAALNRFEDEVK